MSYHVKVAANGRMSLPADVRKRLGIAHGGELVIDETDEGLRLRTKAQVVAEIQKRMRELTRGKSGFGVDDFIAERRREAAKEEEEFQRYSTPRR